MSDLHITNGDGAANLLKASSIAGDVLVWRDPMHHGPFPMGDLDQVSDIRARYLLGDGNDPTEAIRDFQLRNAHLRGFRNYEAVVLWFEHDLLDQLQILQVLDWFAEQDLNGTALEMVCINSFPGFHPFRGLGQLTSEQIDTLEPLRTAVTPAQLQLAKEGWTAFCSDNPNDLLGFIANGNSALPFLKTALLRHLEEFPWHDTGLTRSERQILTLVRDGVASPVDLFIQNMDLEDALFMGDWPTFGIIERMCDAGLLTCSPSAFWYHAWTKEDRSRFRAQLLELTEVGESVVDRRTTAFDAIARDQWLGGVHLHSLEPLWTWNNDAGQAQLHHP